ARRGRPRRVLLGTDDGREDQGEDETGRRGGARRPPQPAGIVAKARPRSRDQATTPKSTTPMNRNVDTPWSTGVLAPSASIAGVTDAVADRGGTVPIEPSGVARTRRATPGRGRSAPPLR